MRSLPCAQESEQKRVDDLRTLVVRQVARTIDRVELGARECLPNAGTAGERDGMVLATPDEQDRNAAAPERRECIRRRPHGVGAHRSQQRASKAVVTHLLSVARYPIRVSLRVQE